MNRILIYILVLLLIFSLGVCMTNPRERALLEALEGTWKSEWEELRILGTQAEITGYYELEGSRLAGVVTAGTLSAAEDGTISLTMGSTTLTGYLEDENTLILGEITYRR